MKFCSKCGNKIELRIPTGDNRERHVCVSCETIHYINPKIVAGTVPTHQGKILLCKRAIEPRHGYWTLPAGFMEMQETTAEAAARETWEEAKAKIDLHGLYSVLNVPHIGQVHIFYRGSIIDGNYGVGEESLETRLFEENEIPWDEIAFPTVKYTLKYFLEDRRKNQFDVHVKDIIHDKLKL